jgi:Protein of unknown function (DUF2934)
MNSKTPPVRKPNPVSPEKAAAAATATTDKPAAKASSPSGGPDRQTRIAEAAYRRAHARNFEAGGELEDWLAAEREVDAEHP